MSLPTMAEADDVPVPARAAETWPATVTGPGKVTRAATEREPEPEPEPDIDLEPEAEPESKSESKFESAPAAAQCAVGPPVWQVQVQAAQGQVRHFAAPAERSLLLAAQDAGLRLPASCRNGSCRVCMCRLRQGEIRYLIDWPGLLAEEKAEGWILPCVAVATSDLVIEQSALRLE